jgi:SAM-dependent methyltransferase
MNVSASELQAFAEALRSDPVVDSNPETLAKIAACLQSDDIANSGAADAAQILLVRSLGGLPGLGFAAVESLAPDMRTVLLIYLARDYGIDETLESVLTDLRRALLEQIAAGMEPTTFGLDLLSALAIFALSREYVFAQSDAEMKAVGALTLFAGPAHVAMIACYRGLLSLHEPTWLLDMEQPTPLFGQMLAAHLAEPLAERAYAADIKSLAPITEQTSRAVQEMYERNPYPRWSRRPPVSRVSGQARARILVAGCGSGQQPIVSALSYPNCRVVGLDLSLASLGYAVRKARGYGIQNLEFLHGDILDLAQSGLRFDTIFCHGVLHHMADPIAGLRALKCVLADGGSIELGLYSEAGRGGIAAAIALRARLRVAPSADGIRTFRQAVLRLPPSDPAREIARFGDFYSVSGMRDMVFHLQEHRFDLAGIENLLRAAGMKLKRFRPPRAELALFQAQFPGADPNSLSAWAKFETLNPRAFRSMYKLSAIAAAC